MRFPNGCQPGRVVTVGERAGSRRVLVAVSFLAAGDGVPVFVEVNVVRPRWRRLGAAQPAGAPR